MNNGTKQLFAFFELRLFCILVIVSLISPLSKSQTPHEQPNHPKGNATDQYQALPHYNEACEYFKNGEINRAKASLYEAISISFALTEAQLFLADILYDQGIRDSALYLYKSGIDFDIEQQPYYYFRLFELGIEQGQYAIVKQNLKYFHQLFKSKGYEAPYQLGFPFDRSHYEFYEDAIELIYDFSSWKPFAEHLKTYNWVVRSNDALEYRFTKGKLEKLKKSSKEKWKIIQGVSADMNDFYLRSDGKVVFSNKEGEKTVLFIGKIKGNKLKSNRKLGESINLSQWNSTPFLSSDNILYYSTERNGQRDIVAAEIDGEGNLVGQVFELNRINTSGNEFAPFFDEENKLFFFSSDTRPGFGRSDIYQCEDFELIHKFINPFNERNCGATINNNLNNVSLSSLGLFIYSTDIYKNEVRTRKLVRLNENEFNYELHLIERTEFED
jgi:hypothetical protein